MGAPGPEHGEGSPASGADRHPTATWVLACQNDDGGFGAFPGDISTVRDTAFALEALEVLGEPVPRPEVVAAFLGGRQNDDGGFRGRPWGTRWTERSTLIDSFYGVSALVRMGREIPRAEALASWVATRQRDDGGFFQEHVPDYPYTSATTEQTFYAVAILSQLNAEVPRREAVLAFLESMQRDQVRGDGGFMYEDIPEWSSLYDAARAWASSVDPYRSPGPEDTRAIPIAVGFTSSTAWGVSALHLMGAEAPDPAGARTFLEARQHASGGFLTGTGDYGAYHDSGEGLVSDGFWALRGLHTLVGAEGWSAYLVESASFDRERLAAWLASCQNPDGSFARRPDPVSQPSDMGATAQALGALSLLGQPIPRPEAPRAPRREVLPEGATFELASDHYQPSQRSQALYIYRLVSPFRAAHPDDDEAATLALMEWLNRGFRFGSTTAREAALTYEREIGNCGNQSMTMVGMLQALGIQVRFLGVEGHNVIEVLLCGRWCLLDPMFQGAFRRPDGRLYSAWEIHERHRRGEPEATSFGDFRYASYTIYWPQSQDEELEIVISPDLDRGSEAVRRAYPNQSFEDEGAP
jgi:transglutaminase-like putative cysteine protease